MPKLSGTDSVKYIPNLSGDVISIGSRSFILDDKELIGSSGINISAHPRVISLVDPIISLDFNIVTKGIHLHSLTDIISGTLSSERFPQLSIEKYHVVNDEIERFALLQIDVKNGDLVKQSNLPFGTEQLFLVIDNTRLNLDEGYIEFAQSIATSCSWNGISGLPNYIKYESDLELEVIKNIPVHLGGDVISGVGSDLIIPNKRQLMAGEGIIINNPIYIISSFNSVISVNFTNICRGDDNRLYDDRTPKHHKHVPNDLDPSNYLESDPLFRPLFTSQFKNKLSGIEQNANRFIHSENPHIGDLVGSSSLTLSDYSVGNNNISDSANITGDKILDGLELKHFRKDLSNCGKLIGTGNDGNFKYISPPNDNKNKILKVNSSKDIVFSDISSGGSSFSTDFFIFKPRFPVIIKDSHTTNNSPTFTINLGDFFTTNSSIFSSSNGVVTFPKGLYYFEFSGGLRATLGGGFGSLLFKLNDKLVRIYHSGDLPAVSAMKLTPVKFSTHHYFDSNGSAEILCCVMSSPTVPFIFSNCVTNTVGSITDKKPDLTELYFLGKKI